MAACGDDGGTNPHQDPNAQNTGATGMNPSTQPQQPGNTTPGNNPNQPNNPGNNECVSDAQHFRQQIWSPILKAKCLLCHNGGGVARNSALVLVESDWGPTYMEKNREVVKEIALNERDGVSLFLLKPTKKIAHAGGKVIQENSDEYRAIEEMLRRLKNPTQCPDEAEKLTKAYARVQLLDEGETLRKASLSLAGRLPTAAEFDAVEGNSAALDTALDKILGEEAFYDRLLNLFNDFFLTDQYFPNESALSLLDNKDYPNKRWFRTIEDNNQRNRMRRYTNQAVAREALQLMVHVVKNRRNFAEILTADYMVVNPFSARAYGLVVNFQDPNNPKEFVETKLPGIPHSGVLTSSMVLNRFPTTATNRNRHRSRKVHELFLATDLNALASRPIDPTQVADHNPTMNNPNCSNCHTIMDPVAGALQNWDTRGRYRPRKEGWFPDMRPPGFGKQTIPPEQNTSSARWLAHQIVGDRRFAVSMVHMVYSMLTGQKPMLEPSDESAPNYAGRMRAYELQTAYFSKIADTFRENGGEIRSIFKEVIKSPYYRASSKNKFSPQDQAVFSGIGSQRLLTPEQLQLRILATTGYPWRYRHNDPDNLLSTSRYRIFYGGIDSESVTQRITRPNGLMSNVSTRMSQEVACYNAARDFAEPKNKRRLFPHVEPSFVPQDKNGFMVQDALIAIRKNIQHLHFQLLGEKLETNDPEVERSFKLFMDVWKDGQKGLADKTYGNYLPYHCRHLRDFWTNKDHPNDKQITQDPNYTIRSWMAVMTYLLSDYRFLHE